MPPISRLCGRLCLHVLRSWNDGVKGLNNCNAHSLCQQLTSRFFCELTQFLLNLHFVFMIVPVMIINPFFSVHSSAIFFFVARLFKTLKQFYFLLYHVFVCFFNDKSELCIYNSCKTIVIVVISILWVNKLTAIIWIKSFYFVTTKILQLSSMEHEFYHCIITQQTSLSWTLKEDPSV